jgi:aspartate/methionine/tyrosine aminotransferase
VLDEDERAIVRRVAEDRDAWLLVDEVYAGTELDGTRRPTWYDGRPGTVVIGSLSKAYGLSGLRLGWLIADPAVTEAAWRRHEYVTISASALSMSLAERALADDLRPALLERNLELIRTGHRTLGSWAAETDVLSVEPAQATPVAFVRLPPGHDSVHTAQRLLAEGDVLVAPGRYFGGFDEHLRITCALEADHLRAALDAIATVLDASR